MINVATCSELAHRWHDLIDQEVERIVARELNVEQAGRELFAERHRRHAGGSARHKRLGGMKAAIHDRPLMAGPSHRETQTRRRKPAVRR
jgi:altronate dehydratase